MKKIKVGRAGREVSALGLGCMRISDLGLSRLDALVHTALDAGIELFDHADIYGGGACEELFGQLLRQTPSLRDRIVLQSKCGILSDGYDLSGDSILRAAEEILGRLQTDHLDLFLLHRPDTLMEPEQIAEAFDRLEREGKVLAFGVSNMNPGQIELLQTFLRQPIAVDQMQFSLARSGLVDSGLHVNIPGPDSYRDNGLLEYCRRNAITIQTWSPLQYGLFEGTFLGSERYPALNAKLEELAEKYAVTPAAVAIAWILRHPARMQVLIGSTDREHLLQAAAAAGVPMTRQEWYSLYTAAGNVLP